WSLFFTDGQYTLLPRSSLEPGVRSTDSKEPYRAGLNEYKSAKTPAHRQICFDWKKEGFLA
ncbi:MAG: hypothetical protein WBW56_05935, partial [Syntrophobacteraceae bacterium]